MTDSSNLIDSRKVIVICDETTWVSDFIQRNLRLSGYSAERGFRSDIVVKEHSELVNEAELIVALWDTKFRSIEGIMEELREMLPSYPFAEKVIALTTASSREDSVFLHNDLGIHKVIPIRNRKDHLEKATKTFQRWLQLGNPLKGIEKAWHNLYRFTATLDMVKPNDSEIVKLDKALQKVLEFIGTPNGRYLDLKGVIEYMRQNYQEAVTLWEQAIDREPNFLEPYQHLVIHHMNNGSKEQAIAITKKLLAINRKGLSSLVSLGSLHETIGEDSRAEHYYKLALSKDAHLSSAINGLASIKFRQGKLEQSRALLAKSQQSTSMASQLNRHGIALVKNGDFEQALGHYTKAQYVLPSHDKGPMLFYNMGLCCSKWGKICEAEQFLRIALIKDPDYQKARDLLAKLPKMSAAA